MYKTKNMLQDHYQQANCEALAMKEQGKTPRKHDD